MKYAADFRGIARNALSGRWTTAVIAGLISSLLGATTSGGLDLELNFEESGGLNFAGQQIITPDGGMNEQIAAILGTGMTIAVLAMLAMSVVYIMLGSVVGVGYSKFNLDLVDRQNEPEIGTLFAYFKHWKNAVVAGLLQWVSVLAWSLLFIIPGIVASYSYAMTEYILAEDPELSAGEAIERSKQMMAGNRFRLFCLELSFIGWDLLSSLTLGIGHLWLTPYKQAARAAFYREVSGTERIVDPVVELQD